MKDTMIGVDLAKRVFQLHGATMTGEVKFRKKRSREQFRVSTAAQNWATLGLHGTRVMGGGQSAALAI